MASDAIRRLEEIAKEAIHDLHGGCRPLWGVSGCEAKEEGKAVVDSLLRSGLINTNLGHAAKMNRVNAKLARYRHIVDSIRLTIRRGRNDYTDGEEIVDEIIEILGENLNGSYTDS